MQDLYDDVLRDGVGLIGLLHDARVMLDGAVFRVNDALYDVYDVHLVLGRLQLILRRLELHRAWHDTVELLDAGRELLGVAKLFLYVFLYALLDLLGTDTVRVYGVSNVVHDGLQLHLVCRLLLEKKKQRTTLYHKPSIHTQGRPPYSNTTKNLKHEH